MWLDFDINETDQEFLSSYTNATLSAIVLQY